MRDEALKTLMNTLPRGTAKISLRNVFRMRSLRRSDLNDPYSQLRKENECIDKICVQYEEAVLECVECFGFNAEEFNGLSDRVCGDKELKRDVKLQAQYYKEAAKMSPEILRRIDSGSSGGNGKGRSRNMSGRGAQRKGGRAKGRETLMNFSKALREVEAERTEIREVLKNDLGIKEFPASMCQPEVISAISPRIQKACKEFPLLATSVSSRIPYYMEFTYDTIRMSLCHSSCVQSLAYYPLLPC